MTSADPTISTSAASVATDVLTISAAAAGRIRHVVRKRPAGAMLRIEVVGGGCSGFSYRFDIADSAGAGDRVIEHLGARVVVDEVSMPYLSGCTLDFVDELIGEAFRINNPNATAACGCGTSFSL